MNTLFLIFNNQNVPSPLLVFLGFSLSGGRMGFPGGTVVKNPPTNARDARDAGSIPGSGGSPKKEMATQSSIPAWTIPWTKEPGGLQSMGSRRAGHN